MKIFFKGFLKALKLPLKLLKGLLRKKSKVKNEREKNLRKYAYNFSPSRLKNISYQKGDKRGKKKKNFPKK